MYAKARTKNEQKEIILAISNLQECITLYESYSFNKKEPTRSLQKCVDFENDSLEPFLFTWNDCCYFQTQMQQYSNIGTLKPLDFTKEDLFSIVDEFYKKAVGGKYYQVFLNQFRKRRDHVRFTTDPTIQGQALHIHVLNETFIETKFTKDFSDITTLIHEYGHAIHFQENFRQEQDDNLIPFSEVISIFMELICYSYFQKTELSKEAKIEKINFWNEYWDNASDLAATINILSIYDKIRIRDFRQLRAEANKYFNISSKQFQDIFQSNPSAHLPYIYSLLIAIELFTIYEKDPDYAFYIMGKMLEIKTLNPLDFDSILRELGLIPNENVQKFQRTLAKESKL